MKILIVGRCNPCSNFAQKTYTRLRRDGLRIEYILHVCKRCETPYYS